MTTREKLPSNVQEQGGEGVNVKKVIKKLLQDEAPPFGQYTGLIGRKLIQPRNIVGAEEAIAKKAELEAKIALKQKIIATLEGMLQNDQLKKKERLSIRESLLFNKADLHGLSDKLSKLT